MVLEPSSLGGLPGRSIGGIETATLLRWMKDPEFDAGVGVRVPGHLAVELEFGIEELVADSVIAVTADLGAEPERVLAANHAERIHELEGRVADL
jgi:hypothetical protein